MSDAMTRESCLCGAVSFTVTGAMRPVVACHCVQCRKTSGHFVAATSAPRTRVAVTGTVTWFRSSPTARRGFCGRCGSNLFWDGPGANLSVHAGTLDQPTGLHLSGHIFCGAKGDYYRLDDGLPTADEADDILATRVV